MPKGYLIHSFFWICFDPVKHIAYKLWGKLMNSWSFNLSFPIVESLLSVNSISELYGMNTEIQRPLAIQSFVDFDIKPKQLNKKIEIFVWSRIFKFLRPAQRYDDFKLIGITCQAACHGKTEHGIFVKFKQTSKTAVVLLAGVYHLGYSVPPALHRTEGTEAHKNTQGAEAPSGHVAQAWAIPPPSWGLRSPNGTDNRRLRQRQTERPPPEPSNILKRFCTLYDDKIIIIRNRCLNHAPCLNRLLPYVPILGTSDFS